MKSKPVYSRIEFLVIVFILMVISFAIGNSTVNAPSEVLDAEQTLKNSSVVLDKTYTQEEISNLVESKLKIIMETGPKASSNPYDYVKNSSEFDELVQLGKSAADYMINEMSKSNANTLKEHIMAIACTKILGINLDVTKGIDGRGWYYKFGTFLKNDDNTVSATPYQQIVNSEGRIVDRVPEVFNNADIEQVVSKAILDDEIKSFMPGELPVESHKILKVHGEESKVNVYVIKAFSFFGFENEIFTVVSGSGATPAVVVLDKLTSGEFNIVDVKNPVDGAGYADSIKKMFPAELHKVALSIDEETSGELWNIQVSKAKRYLGLIGREDANVLKRVDKNWTDKQKSNVLYNINLMRHDFPQWEGSKERLVSIGGKQGTVVRVKFETAVENVGDNEYIVKLTKTWGIKIGDKQPVSWWKYNYKDGRITFLDYEDNDGMVAIIK